MSILSICHTERGASMPGSFCLCVANDCDVRLDC